MAIRRPIVMLENGELAQMPTADNAAGPALTAAEATAGNPSAWVTFTQLASGAVEATLNIFRKINDWATVQQSDWADVGAVLTEATLNLAGSPTQKATLTEDQTMAFAGTVPPGKARFYRFEVTQGAFTLSMSAVNDPKGAFTQPSHTPYQIGFSVNSNGVPIFAGVV